ncbi:MAG: GAP family protein [Actinomycetota bacterium]|nr:GAP family protein [Actinomycetota bacterium]
MWGAVVILAVIAILDPVRVGITAILMSRSRPMANLLVYWLGLMATGIGVAVFVLLVLPQHVLPFTEALRSATHHPVVAPTQIAFGLLAVPVAAVIAKRAWARRVEPAALVGAGAPTPSALIDAAPGLDEAPRPTGISRLSWPALLNGARGNSLGVAFAAGLFSATPPLEYCLVLLAILASGAALGTQISAVFVFALIAFAVAEIPLVSYLVAPSKTLFVVERLQLWMREFRGRIWAVAFAVFGALMMFQGVASL